MNLEKFYTFVFLGCINSLVSLLNANTATTVLTDHNPLTFVESMKSKNQRLLRWSLTLQDFNIKIKHIAGRDNVIADTLSRSFPNQNSN